MRFKVLVFVVPEVRSYASSYISSARSLCSVRRVEAMRLERAICACARAFADLKVANLVSLVNEAFNVHGDLVARVVRVVALHEHHARNARQQADSTEFG